MPRPSKLDNLTIRGFQSIKSLNAFQLRNLNVLIGPNGAGKSNFVTYFRMLSEMVEQRLQLWTAKRGGADRLLTFGVKETEELYSYLQFGANGYSFTLQPTDAGGFVFSSERLYYEDNYPNGFQIGAGHSEAALKDEIVPHQVRIADYCYASMSSWRVFHFHDTSDTAGVKRLGSVDDADYLRDDAANLAAYLYWMRNNARASYDQIRKTVRLALPFFDDFDLDPQVLTNGDAQIRLMWRQINSDYPMSPTQLSDGSLRFICLITALMQPDPPATIIIDEPELGLHPYAITLLAAVMRSVSEHTQLIVSTQSVPLVNEFDIEDLIVVEREAGVSVFRRLAEQDFEEWLEDYTLGELWTKNILGGRPE